MSETRNLSNAPWASIGKRVDDNVNRDVAESMKSANLDWSVGLVDLVTVPKAQEYVNQNDNYNMAMCRQCLNVLSKIQTVG